MSDCYLRFDVAEPISLTRSNSILRGVGRLARVGVQTYSDGYSTWVEFRPPDEVEAMVEDATGIPITLNHPSEFVDGRNFRLLNRGTILGADFKDGWIESPLIVVDQEAVIAAQTTHPEFSMGYLCYVDWQEGVWVDTDGVLGTPGQQYPYDAIQRNIKPNHLALVDQARAGPDAKLIRRDSELFVENRGIAMATRKDSTTKVDNSTDKADTSKTVESTEQAKTDDLDDLIGKIDKIVDAFTKMDEKFTNLDNRMKAIEDKASETVDSAEEEVTDKKDDKLITILSRLTDTVDGLQKQVNKQKRDDFFDSLDAESAQPTETKTDEALSRWMSSKSFHNVIGKLEAK